MRIENKSIEDCRRFSFISFRKAGYLSENTPAFMCLFMIYLILFRQSDPIFFKDNEMLFI